MNELIVATYDLAAFAGMFLLIHVIRQAMNDIHLNRTDSPWVIKARKRAFFADAAFLLLTVCFQDYWLRDPSLIAVGIVTIGLVTGGIAILAVNVISLHMRAPPQNNSGFRVSQAHSWWRPRRG